jgi:hypothetical protein
MLLLILLLGPCLINAFSRFISQQFQWIKFHLLVKEYWLLFMYKPSVQFNWGPLEITWVNPWDKNHHTYPLSPNCQEEAARWVIAPLPKSSWVLVSEGRLVGSRNLRDRWVSQYPIPWKALWVLHPKKVIYDLINLHSCTLRRRYMVS